MDVELDPDQPPEVSRLVEELLTEAERPPDPWWQEGVDEALGNDSGA